MDVEYAKALGVDVDELLLSQPDTGEQGLAIADASITSGAIDMVVVDSVAALTPKAEIDGEIGDSTVGLQARMMSQALRKMSGAILKTGTTAIFINQLREMILVSCLVTQKRHLWTCIEVLFISPVWTFVVRVVSMLLRLTGTM